MMYYILQKDIMQIMNLEKIVKNLWWSLTAFRTINNLPDSIILLTFKVQSNELTVRLMNVSDLKLMMKIQSKLITLSRMDLI